MLAFLEKEKIDRFAFCDFSAARIINPKKLEPIRKAWGKDPESILVFLAPYSPGAAEKGNISVYARSRDYHLYFDGFCRRMADDFRERGIPNEFVGFSDNSPVDEVDLALSSGLGVRGENGLLIDSRYGSYIFIGEIFFKNKADVPHTEPREKQGCLQCGKCVRECPAGCAGTPERSRCLSYLSQKKKLTPEEEALLVKHGVIWGCDVCQEVCPLNQDKAPTPLEFFRSDRIPFVDRELVEKLVREGKFDERAFSWRGKDVLLRNLSLTL